MKRLTGAGDSRSCGVMVVGCCVFEMWRTSPRKCMEEQVQVGSHEGFALGKASDMYSLPAFSICSILRD